jgi:hypothetical protein
MLRFLGGGSAPIGRLVEDPLNPLTILLVDLPRLGHRSVSHGPGFEVAYAASWSRS